MCHQDVHVIEFHQPINERELLTTDQILVLQAPKQNITVFTRVMTALA